MTQPVMDPLSDDQTDEQKIAIMQKYRDRKADAEKQAKLEANQIEPWKFFACLPILFAVVWYYMPLPDVQIAQPPITTQTSPTSALQSAVSSVVGVAQRPFDPTAYEQKVARCAAKEPGGGWWSKQKDVEIDIHYVDIYPTAEKTLLLVHGWPATWSSWRNQVLDFESEYRMIIPTMRGFGNSTSPADREGSSGLGDFADDLVCVLDAAGVEGGAVCIGHDWGSAICFDMAAEHPSRVSALFNSAVPYYPPSHEYHTPRQRAKYMPTLSYQVYLTDNQTRTAAELDARPHDLVKALLAKADTNHPDLLMHSDTILGQWGDQPIAEQTLIPASEEHYWAEAFVTSGFESTIAIYQVKNGRRSLDRASRRASQDILVPTFYVSPTKDVLGNLRPTFGPMKEHIPNLTIEELPTNHWPQLEMPTQFNSMLRTFLAEL